MLPQIPISTIPNYCKTKLNIENLSNNRRKTATTIVSDVENRGIGNHHALKDKHQNLGDSNLRVKSDLCCLDFSF